MNRPSTFIKQCKSALVLLKTVILQIYTGHIPFEYDLCLSGS